MIRTYYQEPPIVQTPLDDVWAVVVPVARTNEISNPSLETATTGYTAGAGSLARSTTQQYHGAYSAAYTPSAATTDGFYYTFTSTVALRAVSCKFLGQKGVPYALAYASTAPSELVTYPFIATGRWQWIWLYVNETSATSRRIYFRKNGSASTATFYVDGVQSEVLADANDRVSTYIDGDQLGLVPNQSPPAYYWNGTPHASTSARSGLTRAGGEVVKFKDFGFTLLAIVGLGLAQPQNVATEYARIDGGYDDYTRKPTRQFTLNGRFDGRTYAELRANRGGLAQLFDRDLSAQDQRLLLLHHLEDQCGNVTSSTSRMYCKYQDGLGGNVESQVAQQTPITFTQYLPGVLADGESGAALSPQTTVANMNYISKRSPAGVWSAMGTGGSGGGTIGVQAIAVGLDGKVYAAGDFTSMGGVANTSGIAYWDGSAWNAMGTGASGGSPTTLAVSPSGVIYAGGSFTSMGGVANTSRIASWNGSAWSSVTGASAANGDVNSIAFDATGNLYIGGNFTSIGGTAANRIVAFDGTSTWTAMGTGAGASVIKVLVGPDGDVYAGGSFTSMGGVSNTGRIARWDVSASSWNALSTGIPTGGSEIVDGLVFGDNTILFVSGQFASAGGVTAENIASWNGVAFQPLSDGIEFTPTPANAQGSVLTRGPQNTILVGGLFDTAGTITVPDSMAIWTGGAFTPFDIDLNGTPVVLALTYGPDGTLYVGHNSINNATVASTTTITNTGTARSYPTFTIAGPSSGTARLYSILNTTTNRALYFSLVLNAGETCTLVLTPDNISFQSTFQGDVSGTIEPGSNTADFFLSPGDNTIAFLSADSTVTATVNWRPNYTGLDDVP